MLKPSDSAILLMIAREAIAHCVSGKPYTPSPREEKKLNDRCGCFVTIRKRGRLRGCIGHLQSQQPLYREVAAMAQAAATQDPRFSPLQQSELHDYDLEITVLSALQKIDDPQQIHVGSHGIYIEKGLSRGVLLPQVATEHGWDRETFLQQTCLKAGLNPLDWQHEETVIYIFGGQIVTEKN